LLLENAARINNIAFIVGESEVIVNIFEATKSVRPATRRAFYWEAAFKKSVFVRYARDCAD
jgi:hypothetical protein